MKINRLGMFLVLLVCSWLVACAQPHTEATYTELTLEQRMEQATIIVAGTVTNVSGVLWNQDNGEYWEEDSEDGGTIYTGTAYYTVDIEVDQFIAGSAETNVLTVTAIGDTPDQASGELVVGNEVVVFAQQTDMAWRGGGTRPILELMGVPTESYLVKGNDGLYHPANETQGSLSLEDLLAKVAEQRASE